MGRAANLRRNRGIGKEMMEVNAFYLFHDETNTISSLTMKNNSNNNNNNNNNSNLLIEKNELGLEKKEKCFSSFKKM
jgi:hypothetical protein